MKFGGLDKGNVMGKLPVMLIGLVIGILFIASIVPEFFKTTTGGFFNETASPWLFDTTMGAMFKLLLPLVIIGGLIFMFLKYFGMSKSEK